MAQNLKVSNLPHLDKKLWFTSPAVFKSKYEIDGTTYINAYDFTNNIEKINYYSTNKISTNEIDINIIANLNDFVINRFSPRSNFPTTTDRRLRARDIRRSLPTSDDTFPLFIYTAKTETEVDEPAQRHYRTIPDSTELWIARTEPRITLLARCYADGLPAHYARLSALSEKIHSSGIGEGHARGDRYDSAGNAGQYLIGFLRWQYEKLRDGVTDNLFRTWETLEDDIAKVEAIMADEAWVKDFYLKHNYTRWAAHSKRGRVHIPTEEYDLGEKIHDTVRLAPGQLPNEEEVETQSEAELLTLVECFGNALHSNASELVTEIENGIVQYTPDFRNAKLATFDFKRPNGDTLMGQVTPNTFDPEVNAYSFTTTQSLGALALNEIEATPAHADATVTGTGTLADNGGVVEGVNTFDVVVTSEDTHATETYTLTVTKE